MKIKNKKTSINLIAIALLISCVNVFGQQRLDSIKRLRQLNFISTTLNLSPQKALAVQLTINNRDVMRQMLVKNIHLTPEMRNKMLRKAEQKQMSNLSQLLTVPEMQKFQSFMDTIKRKQSIEKQRVEQRITQLNNSHSGSNR